MNYGKSALKPVLSVDADSVECPVLGCLRRVPRQRSHFLRHERFSCPDHGIFISPSTFDYADPLDNLLWKDAEDLRLLEGLEGVKRESRMGRERSEDAVSWNVVRGLEKARTLGPWLESISDLPADRVRAAYWGCDPESRRLLPLLQEAREAFGEDTERGSEPDVIVVSEAALFFVEAKFMSGNRTQPSSADRAARYTAAANRWYDKVMASRFDEVAERERFYELTRLWLLGTWAAQRLGFPFCLINLVRAERERTVEADFGKHLRLSPTRVFRRATWEDALRYLQTACPAAAITAQLTWYVQEKTAGFGTDGRLRAAFSL